MTPCESSENSSEEVLFVDEEKYFYDGECHTIDFVQPAQCFPFSIDEFDLLSEVPRAYLRCPDEPIVLFVAVLLGPLALVAAIIFILLCG